MHKKEWLKTLLPQGKPPTKESSHVFCPINIALIKYWGKRDRELMLPYNANLSVALNSYGTKTSLSVADQDSLLLNGTTVDPTAEVARKVFDFLHLLCGKDICFRVETENNIPIASGLASSASSFASFATAANDLFGWNLPPSQLAKVARFGSVSAGRSLHKGFVLMENHDTCDIRVIETPLQDFCMGVCIVSSEEKKHKSRDNMDYTVRNSIFYESWLALAQRDLEEILPHIANGNFYPIGAIAERNALSMHASIAMLQEWDRVYLKPESLTLIRKVQALRKEGLAVFCTVDAGPNVKLLFQHKELAQVQTALPEMSFYERIF